MAGSFFFYDLETSGLNPREQRIMQFAGQRTDMDLQPIGKPFNIMVKLTPDIVPDPEAIMVTGITPQATQADGVTEAEFLKLFYDQVVTDGTIFLGFNTVRFDDEFMRYTHYRNFYDAYEWQWCQDCSRWDLLDLVRMTRALRPDGIEWPFKNDGTAQAKPSNRLELITKLNNLDHEKAHDALNDVFATIAVAKLIRGKQPGLFDYLLDCRGKKKCLAHLDEFIAAKQPFLYTSGKYAVGYLHTTAVKLLAHHATLPQGYVYDLRVDPQPFMAMTVEQLVDCYSFNRDAAHVNLPIKIIHYNRCPAVAPIGILKDQMVQDRLSLPLDIVQKHLNMLKSNDDFVRRAIQAIELVEADRPYNKLEAILGDSHAVDSQLYGGGFFSGQDKKTMTTIQRAGPTDEAFGQLDIRLQDKRLQSLLPLYKARNHPKLLSGEERQAWDDFCRTRLIDGGKQSRLAKYFDQLEILAGKTELSQDQRFALEELQLYGESIIPEPENT